MAWGKDKQQAPAASTLSQLVPLLVTFVLLGAIAWVGYQVYLSVTKIQQQATEKMGTKNVVWTKDGVRVGVKHVQNEAYLDNTQSWVVKAWNLSGADKNAPKSKSK